MGYFRKWLLLLSGFMPLTVMALSENDFAYRATLQIEPGKPFYELQLPTVLYQGVSRWDLGDMRVFNAAGQVVPHGLGSLNPGDTQQTMSASVPFFPLYQQPGQPDQQLRIDIQRDANGEILLISSSQETRGQGRLNGYLLDLRQWQQPVDTLQLNWGSGDSKTFVRRPKVYASDDLTSWKRLGSERVLLNLAYQGHRLEQNLLSLNAAANDYLKLVFSDAKPGLEISDTLVSHDLSSQQPLTWLAVAIAENSQNGHYQMNIDSKIIPRRLRVRLPQSNTLVEVQVLSRSSPEQSWQQRGKALLYRLSVDGVALEQREVTLSSTRDRDWLLRFDQQGGGLGAGLPEVELGWMPKQLLFVARGEPPFSLFWGSASVEPPTRDARQLLGTTDDSGHDIDLLGKAIWLPKSLTSVNSAALRAEAPVIDWQRWLLWSVLVLAALLLITMAIRLFSRMAA